MLLHGSMNGSKPHEAGPTPAPPTPSTQLDRLERWYLDCLVALTGHLGRPPSCLELANWIDRTTTPVHRMLSRLESLGYLGRDSRRRFVVRG